MRLRSQAWHDLHWLTHAPDLLAPAAGLPLASWPATALCEIDRWLAHEGQQDNASTTLTSDFSAPYRRLGLYAEALLRTALQHAASIELLRTIHLSISPLPSAKAAPGKPLASWTTSGAIKATTRCGTGNWPSNIIFMCRRQPDPGRRSFDRPATARYAGPQNHEIA
ncbi:hypothetical protein TKWG_06155 [Advenella kashmirensis WT001]|uniref:Uncharacterized protein n=1 Tax=Advenella kashmirensis (strain DSM 17095 / LMG 22695 / WT001) TaxID=1036672 RepID=I3U9K2_ADVKW|nr:hypothetical protein TKWG_06155 [Advenella kashmirensis WT001]